ncbi:MAG: AMP-binding protein [Aquincola sp.]|nr:AMP-binding protein [Aquincola sp.]MDH4290002.1 AMP-binding protein [Aquincola sp.]MDH5330206.1 AMP-binding protein [Aquincola sp.]
MNGAESLLARHDAARTAIECEGVTVSFGELRERVARAAGAWRANGLRAGQPVAIKLPDGIDWAVAWLGTVWAGGVAVGVNPRIPSAEWQTALEEAGFALIVAEAADDTPASWRHLLLPLGNARRAWAVAESIAPVSLAADDPALWVHSSGSSGRPKAVVHSHRTLARIARVSSERLGIGPGDRLLASSRLFFTYPLVNVLLAGLAIGATVLLDPEWPTAASLARTIAQLRPSVLFSVPTLYRALLHGDGHEGLAEGIARAGVRLCVSAGEALSPQLRQAWQHASGLPMFDGYGCAETLVLVLGAADGDGWLQPSPGVRVRPLDRDAVAQGLPTRLLIEAETLALGYHDRPAAQAESFRGGALCPADLFVQQGHGWRFAGREDSLVKLRGRWVDLAALEETLAARLPGLREAAAVCTPDADGLDAITLYFVADDAHAVRARLSERIALLPPHQRPARLEQLDVLPRTATGKLLRRQLAALSQQVSA